MAVKAWNVDGTIKAKRHAVCVPTLRLVIAVKINGISSWDKPAPMLAQPAETPLARPTTQPENMELIQN